MKNLGIAVGGGLIGSLITMLLASHIVDSRIEAKISEHETRLVSDLHKSMTPIYQNLQIQDVPTDPSKLFDVFEPLFRAPLFDFSDPEEGKGAGKSD